MDLVEVTRLERATCCLQSNCSSQLSYTPAGTSRYRRTDVGYVGTPKVALAMKFPMGGELTWV